LLDRYVPCAVSTGRDHSDYRVELTACLEFSIGTTLEAAAGLTKEEIEDRIEADWMWISIDTDVLLESHWQLESFEEVQKSGT
jgi:hypothetical protein